MATWHTRGQDHLVRALAESLRQGQVAHAYLLVGPRHVGKMTLALDLARAANCAEQDRPCGHCLQCRRIERGLHADVQVLAPGAEDDPRQARFEIGISQVRALQQAAALKPYEGRCRVFILDGVEHLSLPAANALLKTLEEPPDQVLLLLLAAQEEKLLPTLRSRCRRLELRRLPMDQVEQVLSEQKDLVPDQVRLLARLSQGLPGWALSAATDPRVMAERQERLEGLQAVAGGGLDVRFTYAQELAAQFGKERGPVLETLGLWASWWRDLLVIVEGTPELVANWDQWEALEGEARQLTVPQVVQVLHELATTPERLEQNANPRLALDLLMLALPSPKKAALP